MKKLTNKSEIIRAPYNTDNLFTRVSIHWNDHKKLNGFERAIMLEIMSNSDDFIIHKRVIQKRLGFNNSDFRTAWKSLIAKGYIIERKNGMIWEYTIFEQQHI